MNVPANPLIGDLRLDTLERVDAALALVAEARIETPEAVTGRTLFIEAVREALAFEASKGREGS